VKDSFSHQAINQDTDNAISTIVMLGDSLAVGIGATQPEHTPGGQLTTLLHQAHPIAVYCVGSRGAKISEVARHQVPRVAAFTPQLAVVLVGANDVLNRTTKKSFRHSLRQILYTPALSDALIVLFNLPNIALVPAIPRSLKHLVKVRTDTFNHIFQEEADSAPNVLLLDFFSLTTPILQAGSDLLDRDKFHPNDAGYLRMAQEIVALLHNATAGQYNK